MPKIGFKHSEESKRKMSLSLVGNKRSLGVKFSDETRLKMSISHLGAKNVNFGKKRPAYIGERIRESKLGKRLSRETRLRMSKTHKQRENPVTTMILMMSNVSRRGEKRPYWTGEKNPNWKGGITPFLRAVRTLVEYRAWRKAVFERDNYTCVLCGNKDSGNLQADHITAMIRILRTENIKDVNAARKCEYLWDVSNGRTLCVPCHKMTNTYGQRSKITTKEIYV